MAASSRGPPCFLFSMLERAVSVGFYNHDGSLIEVAVLSDGREGSEDWGSGILGTSPREGRVR